ncbi:MAG TPA: FHA domain-containing protein [Vicinamibacterales bacterium]|nr:FHA domain-containing protein [Vicinamibacterales bacterium]
MKKIITKANRVLGTVAEGVRSAIDPRVDLGGDATMLDLRAAVIEHIERSVAAAGRGTRVLPGPVVVVQVHPAGFKDPRALGAVMDDLRPVLIERLEAMKCLVPSNLRVQIKTVSRRPIDWDSKQRFAVVFEKEKSTRGPGTDIAEPRGLRLVVRRGSAQKKVFDLFLPVIRLGRTRFPADSRGHVRTNDIAFADDGSKLSRSVGRGHAEIRFMPGTGTYRVFDQGSANGTRVLRKGRLTEVAPNDPAGLAIQPGDELHIGTAVVRVVKYLDS